MRTRILVGTMVAGLGFAACAKPAPSRSPSAAPSAQPAPVAKHTCKPGMVPIPAGTFMMGETRPKKAGPQTVWSNDQVAVEAFCMDRTEVTTAAYAACVSAGKCTRAHTGSVLASCNAGVAGREQHPINCVDWNQADAYCQAQGLRLPTEEEWEYAATGGDGRTFSWGNEWPSNQLCWNRYGDGRTYPNSTCAVGSYPNGRSPFGVDDMSGNVMEWTSSPFDDSHRVYRGGCWSFDDPSSVRSARRFGYAPSSQSGDMGFRCAGSAALP